MKQKKDQEAPAVTLLGEVRCRDTAYGAGHSYLAVTVEEPGLARILEASAWLRRFSDGAGASVSFYLGWDLPGIRAQPLRTLTNKMIKGRNVVAAPGFDPAVAERDREDRQKVGLVRQLTDPDPGEALVTQLGEIGDRRVDRITAEATDLSEHADLHA